MIRPCRAAGVSVSIYIRPFLWPTIRKSVAMKRNANIQTITGLGQILWHGEFCCRQNMLQRGTGCLLQPGHLVRLCDQAGGNAAVRPREVPAAGNDSALTLRQRRHGCLLQRGWKACRRSNMQSLAVAPFSTSRLCRATMLCDPPSVLSTSPFDFSVRLSDFVIRLSDFAVCLRRSTLPRDLAVRLFPTSRSTCRSCRPISQFDFFV